MSASSGRSSRTPRACRSSSSGSSAAPPSRLATAGRRSRTARQFGVAWSQTSSTGVHSVQLRRVSATSASIIDANTVDASSSTSFGSADIGRSSNHRRQLAGLHRRLPERDRRLARVFTFSSFGLLLAGPGRSCGAARRTSCSFAARRLAPRQPTAGCWWSPFARPVRHARDRRPGTASRHHHVQSFRRSRGQPDARAEPTDVDGFDGRWMVACEDAGSGLVLANVRVLPVTLDAISRALVPGAGTALVARSRASPSPATRLGAGTPGSFRSAGALAASTATMRVAALGTRAVSAATIRSRSRHRPVRRSRSRR